MTKTKSGNGTWKTVATVGSFIVIIGGADVNQGMLSKEVGEVCTKVNNIEPKVDANTVNNAEVNRDIFYMQQDIEEIRDDNKAIKSGINNIIVKIDSLEK